MSQASFVQPRLGDGHFMDSSQKAYNMWTYILHDHIFRNTINYWWDRYLRLQQIRGINHWWDRYLRLQQIRGINHWWDRYLRFTVESEIYGSTSTQLVQLSIPSNIPGVSMVKNTGDSEDHLSCRTDKRIREMWFHLNTASSTTYTL